MINAGSLEDRTLIRELYGCYASAGGRGEKASWLDCWAADAEWVTTHFRKSGKDEIGGQWDAMWTSFSSALVLNDVGPIAVSGDRATARCGVLEVIRMVDGSIMRMAGHYEDEIVRVDGSWRFSRRSYTLLSDQA